MSFSKTLTWVEVSDQKKKTSSDLCHFRRKWKMNYLLYEDIYIYIYIYISFQRLTWFIHILHSKTVQCILFKKNIVSVRCTMPTSSIPSPFLCHCQVLLVSSIKRVFTLKSITLVIKGNIKMGLALNRIKELNLLNFSSLPIVLKSGHTWSPAETKLNKILKNRRGKNITVSGRERGGKQKNRWEHQG